MAAKVYPAFRRSPWWVGNNNRRRGRHPLHRR